MAQHTILAAVVDGPAMAEPDYCQAKLARDAAELEVYRAWIEAERLNDMLAVARTLIRDTVLAESPEEISH